ncbi:hypothetical protein PR048_013160 [Dryococelus australis]|uniref:Uncharacterized protein n=1 Tax=Dryococelus australis TaxID=614101 RepID=A0ABQ9HRJ6_9NEOP|nr:hypothetical protein PR048_013160 [Dryococelus australis]
MGKAEYGIEDRDGVFLALYVWSCHGCQCAKQTQYSKVGMYKVPTPVRAWQRVYMDVLGPLPRSSKGIICLLISIYGWGGSSNVTLVHITHVPIYWKDGIRR